MASENAKAVAREVIQRVRKGEKVNFQEIQQNHGYSANSAKSMKAKETETYKMEIKPLADRLKDEIDRIQLEMTRRDLTEEKYQILVDALDKINKNYQLVSGGATERVINIQLSPEIANKNGLNATNTEPSTNSEGQS